MVGANNMHHGSHQSLLGRVGGGHWLGPRSRWRSWRISFPPVQEGAALVVRGWTQRAQHDLIKEHTLCRPPEYDLRYIPQLSHMGLSGE